MFDRASADVANIAPRETLADDLTSRVAQMQERIARMTGQLHAVADRAFGEQGGAEGSRGTADSSCRSGRLGDVADALDYLSQQIAELEGEASRFMHIA